MPSKPHPGVEQNKRAAEQLEDMGRGFAEDRARKQRDHDQAVRDRYEREGRTYETQLDRLDRQEKR